jgi:hypothetical protein
VNLLPAAVRGVGAPPRVPSVFAVGWGVARGVELLQPTKEKSVLTEMMTPTTDARQLFNRMVARAKDGILSPYQCILVAIEIKRDGGEFPRDEVFELRSAGWITPHESGGWAVLSSD